MNSNREKESALGKRLQGMAESIAPMGHPIFYPRALPAFRSGGCRGIGPAGKNRPCSSSAMSSGRLFLDGALASVARLCFTGISKVKPLPSARE
jgi:hypothetical protein